MNVPFARYSLAIFGLLAPRRWRHAAGAAAPLGVTPPVQAGAPLAAAPTPTPTPAAGGSLAPAAVPLVVSTFAPTQTVDPADVRAQTLAVPAGGPLAVLHAQRGAAHLMPLYHGGPAVPGITVSADRRTVTRARQPSTTYVGYPGDMYYRYYSGTGYVVGGSVSHDVFVNCAPSCWGKPGQFLTDFYASSFVGVPDQYIGLTAHNRYTKGTTLNAQLGYVPGTTGSGPNPVVARAICC